MKKANKLLSTVVVSSALLTTVAVAASSSANNMRNINNVDMQLGITANSGGKSAKLSVHNVNMTNAFDLDIKIEGDVKFKSLDFTDNIKQNAITKVNYDESSKVLNIVVTSDIDLAKGGILEIGNIIVDGTTDVEYKILDNSGITMITPTYDEISDNDLQEIGDTQITVGENVQPPVEDEGDIELPPVDEEQKPQEPPVNEDDTTTPPNGGTEDEGDELPPSNEEQNPAEPPVNGDDTVTPPTGGTEGDAENGEKPPVNEDISVPTEDIEVTEGKDGYKLVTPKTKEALDAVINAILGQDTSAKIVDIKENSTYYIYRVKYKKVTKSDSEYGYVDIKVAKDIRAEEGLPGIDVENSNDQNQGSGKPDNDEDISGGNGTASNDGNTSTEAVKPNNSGSTSVENSSNNTEIFIPETVKPNNSGSTSVENSSNNTQTSTPQTGDTNILGFVAISVAALSGIFINNRKK